LSKISKMQVNNIITFYSTRVSSDIENYSEGQTYSLTLGYVQV
jgi:hypothetical protein